jgi:hypothetical protein
MSTIYLMLIGLAAGVLCGLLGIGGGTVVIPALLFLYKFEMKEAIGTSLVFITFASFMGVIGHQQLQHINWKFGVFMAVGAILGVFIGVRATQVIPNLVLKRIFGVFLLVVSIQLMTAG